MKLLPKHRKSENLLLNSKCLFHEFQVIFEAHKTRGLSDIALDDISLTSGICKESIYPEPTLVPTVATTTSLPSK